MKAITLCAALCCVTGIAAAADADPPSPDVAVFNTFAVFGSGSAGGEGFIITTVPAGKRLVVQAVSYAREGVLPIGSAGNCRIIAKINGLTMFYTLPSVLAQGEDSPGTAVPLTFYANAGTQLTVNFSRGGDLSGEESDQVFVSGYYVTP